MEQSELLIRILLTIIFGAILGLETETREIESKGKQKALAEEKSRLGGLRTYTILSLFGGVAGIFYLEDLAGLVYLMFTGIFLLILAAYILNVQVKKAFGLTTEITILITFLLGFLTTSDLVNLEVVLVILVLLGFFLSQKRGFGYLIHKIQHRELIDIIKFGLVAVVILPLLPNTEYYIADALEMVDLTSKLSIRSEFLSITLINPFKMWTIVVLMSGLELLGYLISKFIGAKRGVITSGVLGGLVSSTTATVALAHKSRDENESNSKIFAGGALIANAVSYYHTLILLLISSITFFNRIVPTFVVMSLLGLVVGGGMIFKNNQKKEKSHRYEIEYEPFSIVPAVKFVALIVLIKLAVQLLQLTNLGNLSLLITALSGLSGLDAAAIAMADLSRTGEVTLELGILILLAANAINFLAKGLYAYVYASRPFLKNLVAGLLVTLIGSLVIFI